MKKIAIVADHSYDTLNKESAPSLQTFTNVYGARVTTIKKGQRLKEHFANASTAYYVSNILKKQGFEVVNIGFTTPGNWRKDRGNTDVNAEVRATQKKVKESHCDACIAINYDWVYYASGFGDAKGHKMLIRNDEALRGDSLNFSKAILAELDKLNLNEKVSWCNGIMESTAGMCNTKGCGVSACAVPELAFYSSWNEFKTIFASPRAHYKLAVAIAKGVCNYYGVKYK